MTTYIKIGATSYNAADYTLPAERTFRDGWEANDDGTITVNMTKAKDIWRDKIRAARNATNQARHGVYESTGNRRKHNADCSR